MPKKRRSVDVANAYEATSTVSTQGLLSVGDLTFWDLRGFHVGFITSIIEYDRCGKIYANLRLLVRTPTFAWKKTAVPAMVSVEVSCLRTLVYTMDEGGTCAILFPPV